MVVVAQLKNGLPQGWGNRFGMVSDQGRDGGREIDNNAVDTVHAGAGQNADKQFRFWGHASSLSGSSCYQRRRLSGSRPVSAWLSMRESSKCPLKLFRISAV